MCFQAILLILMLHGLKFGMLQLISPSLRYSPRTADTSSFSSAVLVIWMVAIKMFSHLSTCEGKVVLTHVLSCRCPNRNVCIPFSVLHCLEKTVVWPTCSNLRGHLPVSCIVVETQVLIIIFVCACVCLVATHFLECQKDIHTSTLTHSLSLCHNHSFSPWKNHSPTPALGPAMQVHCTGTS